MIIILDIIIKILNKILNIKLIQLKNKLKKIIYKINAKKINQNTMNKIKKINQNIMNIQKNIQMNFRIKILKKSINKMFKFKHKFIKIFIN